ncbi:uncharacterized protein F5891DRAFT_962068, partial [Suillus fuscotomentosus]
LCSQLRILPKPYLVIKETFVREYACRGGKLRRREARDPVKIDVNKASRVTGSCEGSRIRNLPCTRR